MGWFFSVVGPRLPPLRQSRTPSYDEEVLCAGWNPVLEELQASLPTPASAGDPGAAQPEDSQPEDSPDAAPAQLG